MTDEFVVRKTSRLKLFLSDFLRELHMMDTTNWHKMRGEPGGNI